MFFAHLPERFMPQRRINTSDLPSPAIKLQMLQRTIEQLTDAGYRYIGMDTLHLPDDELAIARKNQPCSATSRAIPPTGIAT